MIDVAVLGAGRMGKVHGGNVSRHPGARVRYVVDNVSSSASALSTMVGAEVTSLKTVLSDSAIRAVIITTPTPTHADLIEACARSGKAIFCEKPIDLTLARVDACLAVVKEHAVPFMVAFQRRFDPTFRALHRSVAAGKIGDIEVVRITSRDPHIPPPGYVATSGGIFRDMMIHDFDMARWLLAEEPVEVYSTGSCLIDPAIGKLSDVDTAITVLRTRSGKLCHIENSRRAVYGYDQRVEVLGSKGMLQAENQVPTTVILSDAGGVMRDKPLAFFPERYVDAYAAEIAHFIDALSEGTSLEIPFEAGRASLALADAAQRSLDTNSPIELD